MIDDVDGEVEIADWLADAIRGLTFTLDDDGDPDHDPRRVLVTGALVVLRAMAADGSQSVIVLPDKHVDWITLRGMAEVARGAVIQGDTIAG